MPFFIFAEEKYNLKLKLSELVFVILELKLGIV